MTALDSRQVVVDVHRERSIESRRGIGLRGERWGYPEASGNQRAAKLFSLSRAREFAASGRLAPVG